MNTIVIKKLIEKANNKHSESEALLDKALKAWLEQMDFPDYIYNNFWITFASGAENIVHYSNNDMNDISLERLMKYTKEQVIDYFDIIL